MGYGGAYAAFVPAPEVETDEELRERLLYVAGDGAAAIQRIATARGAELDTLAAMIKLKRRGT